WVCHAVRAPGSNATRFATMRAGACVAIIGSCQTVPVKYSFGARRLGREPAIWISIAFPPLLTNNGSVLRSFLGSRVPRLCLCIHGIEARPHPAGIHLLDHPGFHPFLLS